MATTKINVTAVLEAGTQAKAAAQKVAAARAGTEGVRSRVDGKILSRGDLSGRFRSLTAELSAVENRIRKILDTAQDGAAEYHSTDFRLKAQKRR